jgi:hypothetical protein
LEGHQPFDRILWVSILEDRKLLGVLGDSSWFVWIHEKLQLDPLRLVRVRLINPVHLLHFGSKRNGGSCTQKEAKQRWIWKTYSWPLPGLKFFNRSVITVLYVEKKIKIYGFYVS